MAWVTPPVFTVLEVAASADLNTISGDLNFLKGDLTWTTPSFSNSWVNNSGDVAYRKVGDLVICRGLISGGTSGTVAWTFPAAYSPTGTRRFAAFDSSVGLSLAQIAVASSGAVTPTTSGAPGDIVTLDGVIFSTL